METKQITSKELTIAILKVIAVGALVIGVLAAPGLGVLFKHFKMQERKQKARISQRMRDLARRGYIEKIGERYCVSKKGIRLLSEDEVWSIAVKTSTHWDGKWHFVLFDIPGAMERPRQALRARLVELGYKRYQNSVFIHKHDLRKAVIPFAEFYNIRKGLRFITATHID